MTNSRAGFTLIELMVSVAVMAIIISSGVNIFFRSLQNSSSSDLKRQVDTRSRVILDSLSRYLREARIVSLDGFSRTNCYKFGSLSGSSLVTNDIYSVPSTISLNGAVLASSSAFGTLNLNPESTISVVPIPPATSIFTWKCAAGRADNLEIQIRISAGGGVYNDFIENLTLRNTGQ